MALLTEYHKWERCPIKADPENYAEYLRGLLGDEWYESRRSSPLSHWGPNAHRCEIRWNPEDWERTRIKPKKKNGGNGNGKTRAKSSPVLSDQELLAEVKKRGLFKSLMDAYPYLA